MSRKEIKSNKAKIEKTCTNCFQPKYFKFNFSFINYEEGLEDRDKIQLYERIKQISSEPYLIVSSWDKKIGFENISLKIDKEINPKFFDGHRYFDGKYTILRLYTNNNPTKGRIIGKLINKVFYIFFIDAKGKLYSHDKKELAIVLFYFRQISTNKINIICYNYSRGDEYEQYL